MKDVAVAAGVSVMTVSRAFKADKSVSKITRLRIMQIADDLGYMFDSTAATLRTQRTGFVAVTIPSINNANFADSVTAMSDVLAKVDMQVLLGNTNYDIHKEEELISHLLQRRPEAIVVTGGRHTERARKMLMGARIPVFETWDLPDEPLGHVVGFSNAATMDAMVEYLSHCGYRRISFIGGDTDGDTRGADRRRGFIRAMTRHGLDPSRLIGAGVPPISMSEGAAAMARLLEQLPDTEAVICVSDLSAFGALTECMRRGIAVPRDMAIAGFGAYEIAGISVPTITTINPYPAFIGRCTAEYIMKLLQRGSSQEKFRLEVRPDLIIGGSTRFQDEARF